MASTESSRYRKGRCENKLETREMVNNRGIRSFDFLQESKEGEGLFRNQRKLLLSLVVFRILNAFVIRTFFVPDEYWQGPEVAHKLVFGYGYLTWEWSEGIRGYTFPLVFSLIYKILSLLKLDYVRAVILGPRAIQGMLAGVGDLYLYKLATKLFDHKVGMWTLLCNVMSWFTFYCVTRTVTNSTETVLTVMGLYHWPWSPVSKQAAMQSNVYAALLLAGAACLVRPTAAIVWVPLALLHLITTDSKLRFLFQEVLPIGFAMLGFSVIIDSWFYGKLIFVQFKFLQFNVLNNVGAFYGSHPWYWYFTEGFGVIMFTHLLAFFPGVCKSPASHRIAAWLMLWVVFVYSFLDHKEFRFIFPILPLGMCYCGYFFDYLCKSSPTPAQKDQGIWNTLLGRHCNKATALVWLLLITNVPVALYTSLVHQRGTIDVMYYIQEQCKTSDKKPSVLFLMPCHSTPFYSYVHQNISMQFLTCEPSSQPGYVDEADIFYRNATAWSESHFKRYEGTGANNRPTHIVFFNALLQELERVLEQFHYKECARFFHTHFPDKRVGSEVLVYCTTT